jgi:hypothetical protein
MKRPPEHSNDHTETRYETPEEHARMMRRARNLVAGTLVLTAAGVASSCSVGSAYLAINSFSSKAESVPAANVMRHPEKRVDKFEDVDIVGRHLPENWDDAPDWAKEKPRPENMSRSDLNLCNNHLPEDFGPYPYEAPTPLTVDGKQILPPVIRFFILRKILLRMVSLTSGSTFTDSPLFPPPGWKIWKKRCW